MVIEQHVRVRNPRRVFGKVVVASGYFVVWFRGKWYDLGKFYDRKGKFTGYYCDIIRPVGRLLSSTSTTAVITDLFLDLWIGRDGRVMVLDEDHLNRALRKHAISVSLAKRACSELRHLIQLTKAGHFPPPSIRRFQPTTYASRS